MAFKKNCGNIFILVIVLFATLANEDDWAEIAMFADYYQTEYIKWLEQKGAWKGLKSIIMERKNIKKETKNEWNTVISLVA